MTAPESSHSQHGEDLVLARRFAHKTGGFFVEVGALDGITYSNTALFERELGWTGVLVEANPHQAALCARDRPQSTTVAKAASSPERRGQKLDFTVVAGFEALSSVRISERTLGIIDRLQQSGDDLTMEHVQVETDTLDEILTASQAPAEMDLLSIDIEGHELDALRGLSLGKPWQFSVILIENNSSLPNYRIHLRLARAGYRYVQTLGEINDWYEPAQGPLDIVRGLIHQHWTYSRHGIKRIIKDVLHSIGMLEIARSAIGHGKSNS